MSEQSQPSQHTYPIDAAGSYPLGSRQVRRVGYGAMQLAGDNVFGPPRDRDEALAVLRTAVQAGVNHIDTAEFYGPRVVNELIREALHPYPADLAIVSKVGARRDTRGAVLPFDEPDELRQGIEQNLATLDVDRLAAVNLRLMDGSSADAWFDAQLASLIRARDEGLIDGVGLSNVSLEQLLRAVEQTEIVCVQNWFNLADQRSPEVLEECARRGIAFAPFFPLGYPRSARTQTLGNPVLTSVAARLKATPAQIALAWLLDRAPNVLLIPGTRTRAHLSENLGAAIVELDDEAREHLSRMNG
ncbi:oxidoreductase [Actinospica sp.]|uniref:oxidoreductase n=1 Tax=Actinospica sp. TaxID=1872142 RepID=UPI002B5F422D|nr:oxidoreductase [Actinospica sp.]HWG26331.1 oxidoreductase [Actinospica sp.]